MLSDTDTHPQHVLSPQHPQVAPSPDPSASLHSILASTKDHDHIHPWSPMTSSANAQQTPPLPIQNSKRKLDEPDQDDPHPKIRKTVREHVSQDPARVVPMTTVMCLHAAVAQKSYGSEKRFLCPPPVVHIQGPVWQMRSQQLSMSVVSEQGERSFDQKTSLDNNMTGSFKFLHVTGTAKAKSFQLSLDIADPATTEGGDTTSAGRVWATFDSAPVTIISKPSKKTAKTRNISSCILAGGPVSLFNRINSQTVRTKYMTIDAGQLCASNTSWSAFNVNVVHRPDDAPPHSGPQPVTYGCQVVLSDTMSNIATGPLVIRKVDKGRVSNDDGGPVSQMQKIALQRVNPDGSHHYLSAQGPIPGTPNVVSPSSQGIASQGGTHPLIFQSPRIREETKDDTPVFVDEVDDYLCWTIVGISKFQYTFFDAFGQNNSIPPSPITPFPTLFASPIYRASTNTIEMTVSHFFYEDPKTRTQMPLTVYLGNIGPLHSRVYQAAPPGPLTTVSPYVQPLTGPSPLPVGSDDSTSAGGATSPSGPSAAPRFVAPPLHTIVMVELPPIPDVIKALQEDALPPPGVGPSNGPDISDIQVQPAANGRSSPRGQTEGAEASENPPSHPTPPPPISGRSLPLLFIRASDGVGYHSGRTITCENMFESMDLASMTGGAAPPPPGTGIDTNWLAAAQAAAQADGNMHGWTLRVM
ncbi:hypothetical protein CONPUDRAFT_86757 [Coniophora puteana RWD-64-598 SS2]|uniref:Beta-trefoil n=1 Tax=Coniophora puteana (strain RWD-64-598) TaxID=741705 RepID=A0A5M3N7J2_CONPW|nr:uncharacterized protein CONPUDRAFT_86757 [Coniophora puteana RWD-64-598 SS2]EIW86821.1 hypothetical protein CONPUDRAFT_86757 [Coniophora puteana RWD-64-598 SS2]